MKKIVSYLILFSMILSTLALMPLTVGAAGTTNTSEYFEPASKTGLDAYYGTPAIATWLKNSQNKAFGAINGDKTITTLKDSAWDNAYKLTVNSTTNALFGGTANVNSDYDIWLLWDNENLYILQDTRGLYTIPTGQVDKTMNEIKTTALDIGVWDNKPDDKAEHGFSEEYGARAIRRAVLHLFEDPFSLGIVKGEIDRKSTQTASIENGEIVFREAVPSP